MIASSPPESQHEFPHDYNLSSFKFKNPYYLIQIYVGGSATQQRH